MKVWKIFDRFSIFLSPVGPFVSAVEAFKVWACKGFSKELLWRLDTKSLKKVFRSSKNYSEWFQIVLGHFLVRWRFKKFLIVFWFFWSLLIVFQSPWSFFDRFWSLWSLLIVFDFLDRFWFFRRVWSVFDRFRSSLISLKEFG